MTVIIIRTIVMYIFVVVTLRIMGKRQIGELEASELVVTIIISDIAAMPITNMEVPVITNAVAILLLMVMEVLLSYAAYKSPAVRNLFYGKPSLFFKNGRFNQKEMLRQRFNIADIMEEIRGNGACSLEDIEYIIMETNGKVSVVMKSEKSPVTCEQFNMEVEKPHMNYIVIDNGNVIKKCMDYLGLDENWLNNKLKEHNLKSAKDVFYLSFEQDTGKTVLIKKEV